MEKKELKSLEAYNQERFEQYNGISHPSHNGIACPKCGAELYDSNDGDVPKSYPPQRAVYCVKCDFRGLRFLNESEEKGIKLNGVSKEIEHNKELLKKEKREILHKEHIKEVCYKSALYFAEVNDLEVKINFVPDEYTGEYRFLARFKGCNLFVGEGSSKRCFGVGDSAYNAISNYWSKIQGETLVCIDEDSLVELKVPAVKGI